MAGDHKQPPCPQQAAGVFPALVEKARTRGEHHRVCFPTLLPRLE